MRNLRKTKVYRDINIPTRPRASRYWIEAVFHYGVALEKGGKEGEREKKEEKRERKEGIGRVTARIPN